MKTNNNEHDNNEKSIELIKKVKNGDKGAFDNLYLLYEKQLRSHIHQKMG